MLLFYPRCLARLKQKATETVLEPKKQQCHFANKDLCNQRYGFSSSHVRMWELDHKKAEHQRIDAFKLWCWRRLLRVPWTARRPNQWILKKIKPKYSLEGETLIVRPPVRRAYSWPHVKSWLIRKDPDARKDWRKEEKGTTENKMVGWVHWLSGHEFEQAPWDCERQGSLACCSPWGCKEADTAEWLSSKRTMTLGIYHNAQDIVGTKCIFVEWIN